MVLVVDLDTNREVYRAYLCEECAAVRFSALRPYIARSRPYLFDRLIALGVV